VRQSPDLGEFELVADNIESLRQLVAKFASMQQTEKSSVGRVSKNDVIIYFNILDVIWLLCQQLCDACLCFVKCDCTSYIVASRQVYSCR
jgi:hypothetical protein